MAAGALALAGIAGSLRVAMAAEPSVSLATSPAPGTARRAVIAGFSPFGRTAVRRAIDTAIEKLALPGCSDIYADFKLPDGGTPRDRLERMGLSPEELLESLVFIEGSRDRACRTGPAILTTVPGRYVIHVCPGFPQLALSNPSLSASLVIHESLHALGLGENPPTSSAITSQVERHCWKTVTTPAGDCTPHCSSSFPS